MSSDKALFFFEKKNGCMSHCGDIQSRLFDAWVSSQPEGQVYEVEYRKRRHKKTHPQLGYWYGVLMPFASDELRAAGWNELFDITVSKMNVGVATTPQTADLLFKTLFGANQGQERMPLKRSMSDADMGRLIDFTREWLAKNLGAVSPEPEK